MNLNPKVPVYIVNGFLESGKTLFIRDTMEDPYFTEDGSTLIIACEDGVEEYDPAWLKGRHFPYEYVEGIEDFTLEKLEAFKKQYKPSKVMIEYNGMWGMEAWRNISFPRGWFPAQQITLVDATTFDVYMQNMKSQFMDMIQESDLVIFNRCTEDTKASSYKRNIRAANPRAQVDFEREAGEPFEFEDELPFDINADIVDIGDIDYGIWYVDAMDHPDHYDGKTIRFKCCVMKSRGVTKGYFVPGRRAMTCCADDTMFLGFLCKSQNTDKLKNGMWITLTAKVNVEKRQEYSGEEGPVLYTKAIKSAEKPEEELVYF